MTWALIIAGFILFLIAMGVCATVVVSVRWYLDYKLVSEKDEARFRLDDDNYNEITSLKKQLLELKTRFDDLDEDYRKQNEQFEMVKMQLQAGFAPRRR